MCKSETCLTIEPLKEELQKVSAAAPTNEPRIYPNLSSDLNLNENSNLNRWREKSLKKEVDEEFNVNLDFTPVHLATYRNFLFCINESEKSESLIIFSVATTQKIELKNMLKLGVPNIRGIAANQSYFGLTFSKLKSNEMRGMFKNLKPNGIFLFKRELHTVCAKYDKFIDLPNTGFKKPVGIAMNDEFVFVCDKELGQVFKIIINTGLVVNKIDFKGRPFRCSLNKDYLLVTDILNHELSLFDMHNLTTKNRLVVEQKDRENGPYDVLLTEDNLIFYKNYWDSQLVLTDVNFSEQICFKNIKSPIFGYSLLQCSSQQKLIIGTITKQNQYKFISYCLV